MASSISTKQTVHKYGIYYPEGSGYLHLDNLSPGSQGSVALVLGCADKKLYLRKRGNIIACDPSRFEMGYGCDEVFYYRLHELIPNLIDWTIYRPLPRSHPSYYECCSTSTIWEYCRGGDLRQLLNRYRKLNKVQEYGVNLYPYKFHIPEAFIWKAFGQLIRTVTFLHHARPAVCHLDIFVGNVFLHRSNEGDLPDCCLGDFGKSALLAPSLWDSKGRLAKPETLRVWNPGKILMRDFKAIISIIKQLMTLEYLFRPDERTVDFERRQDALLDDLEMAHTGQFADLPTSTTKENSQHPLGSDERVRYQSIQQDGIRRYSPLLFDTIHQLESRVNAISNLVWHDVSPNTESMSTNEIVNNPDWSYLGESMERKAAERMQNSSTQPYPVVDNVFEEQIKLEELSFTYEELCYLALCTKEQIAGAIHDKSPVGPFRIARLDPQTLDIIGISRKTYNSFEYMLKLQDSRANAFRGVIRPDSYHSVAHDPMQVSNVAITRRLNY